MTRRTSVAARSSVKALLSSSFNFTNPALLFARARLYSDRIELTGWCLRGRYRRAMEIRQVLQVDVAGDWELLIWLATGETLRLRVDQSAQWKAAIDACMAGEAQTTAGLAD